MVWRGCGVDVSDFSLRQEGQSWQIGVEQGYSFVCTMRKGVGHRQDSIAMRDLESPRTNLSVGNVRTQIGCTCTRVSRPLSVRSHAGPPTPTRSLSVHGSVGERVLTGD